MNNFPSKTFERIYLLRSAEWTLHLNGGPRPMPFDEWLRTQAPDKATLRNAAWIKENARRRAESLYAAY